MKQRLVKLLIAGLAALTLAGCGAIVDDSLADRDEYDAEDDDDDEDEDEDEDEEEPEEPEAPAYSEEYLLMDLNVSRMAYILDGDGEILYTIDKKDIQDSLKGVDEKYCVYSEELFDAAELRLCGDGFLFFYEYLPDENWHYHSMIFAVGGVYDGNYELYPLWEGSEEEHIEGFDYYKGALYLDISLGHDEDYNATGYKEMIFTFDENAGSFICEESAGLDELFDKAVSDKLSLRGQTGQLSSEPYCFRRTLDDCGFILAKDQDRYVLINEKGKLLKLSLTDDDSYSLYYDAGHAFFIHNDYVGHNYTAMVYDIETGELSAASDTYYDPRLTTFAFISSVDSKYYYAKYDYAEYGIRVHDVYEYDASEGTTTFLYEEKTVPGSTIMPGTDRVTIAGNYLYYMGFEDGNIIWMRKNLNDDSAPENFGIVISRLDKFDLGTIDYKSLTYTCPDCGTDLVMKYCEYFVLDKKYSDHAAEINEFFEQIAVEAVDWENDYYVTSCEDHQENPSYYQVSDSINVDSAFIISDRYLAVNMSGYWYGGGAHGYPSRVQYLFDLETGEELTVFDFYTGTEKEFAELIAQKTVEDFLSYDEYGSPYFAVDSDEIYSDAVYYAQLGEGVIEFTEEGIYYCYPPYDMGPYAAGYIEIFVTYGELLGRDTL